MCPMVCGVIQVAFSPISQNVLIVAPLTSWMSCRCGMCHLSPDFFNCFIVALLIWIICGSHVLSMNPARSI